MSPGLFSPHIDLSLEVLSNTLLINLITVRKWTVSSRDVRKAQQEHFIWDSVLELPDHIYY